MSQHYAQGDISGVPLTPGIMDIFYTSLRYLIVHAREAEGQVTSARGTPIIVWGGRYSQVPTGRGATQMCPLEVCFCGPKNLLI
jgi:hypothetical protein